MAFLREAEATSEKSTTNGIHSCTKLKQRFGENRNDVSSRFQPPILPSHPRTQKMHERKPPPTQTLSSYREAAAAWYRCVIPVGMLDGMHD